MSHNKTDNPYAILGVANDADLATVKHAYHEIVKSCHPDSGGVGADPERFMRVHDAFLAICADRDHEVAAPEAPSPERSRDTKVHVQVIRASPVDAERSGRSPPRRRSENPVADGADDWRPGAHRGEVVFGGSGAADEDSGFFAADFAWLHTWLSQVLRHADDHESVAPEPTRRRAMARDSEDPFRIRIGRMRDR